MSVSQQSQEARHGSQLAHVVRRSGRRRRRPPQGRSRRGWSPWRTTLRPRRPSLRRAGRAVRPGRALRRAVGGPGGPGGQGRGWAGGPGRRGPKARRGDVRAAALSLLAEGPRNGYQIIQEVAERSGGLWRPSPGSVYPALQQLQDEGLVRSEEGGGQRAFHLTDQGRAYVEAHPEELAAPWEALREYAGPQEWDDLRQLLGQVATAVTLLAQAGEGPEREARRILTEARRALYGVLAEDGPGRSPTTRSADDVPAPDHQQCQAQEHRGVRPEHPQPDQQQVGLDGVRNSSMNASQYSLSRNGWRKSTASITPGSGRRSRRRPSRPSRRAPTR